MTEAVTCGVFLVDPEDNVLIVHATNASWNQWGIPKGLPDQGESCKQAAIRELQEETGLDVGDLLESLDQVKYLGSSKYQKRKKRLEAYWIFLDHQIEMEQLECTSMVEHKGKKTFPEVDKFMTVPLKEADKWLHQTQIDLLPILKREVLETHQKKKLVKKPKKFKIIIQKNLFNG